MDALLATYGPDDGSSSSDDGAPVGEREEEGASAAVSSLHPGAKLPGNGAASASIGAALKTEKLPVPRSQGASGKLELEGRIERSFSVEPVTSVRGTKKPPSSTISQGASSLFSTLPAPKGASKPGAAATKKVRDQEEFRERSVLRGNREENHVVVKPVLQSKRELEEEEEEENKVRNSKRHDTGASEKEGKSGLAAFLPPPKHTLGSGTSGGGRRTMMDTNSSEDRSMGNGVSTSSEPPKSFATEVPTWTDTGAASGGGNPQGSYWNNPTIEAGGYVYAEGGRMAVQSQAHQSTYQGLHGDSVAQGWDSNSFFYGGSDGAYSSSTGGTVQNWSAAALPGVNFSSEAQHHSYACSSGNHGSEAAGATGSSFNTDAPHDPLIEAMASVKRRDKSILIDGLQFKEVKQQDLTKGRVRDDQLRSTGIAFGPSYQPVSAGKDKPSKVHRRKHQISSLYYDMKLKEMDLTERRSKGQLTKAETQAKYGW